MRAASTRITGINEFRVGAEMMQQDGQMVFVVEAASSGVDQVFQLLASHGVLPTASDVHLRNGLALIEMFAPPAINRNEALRIGAELASVGTVRGSALVALHRRARADAEGRSFERRTLADWSRPMSGFVAAQNVTREAA